MNNRGYRKLFVFEVIIILLLSLNSFMPNILSGYKFILFLFLLLIIFKIFFSFEKDRHRYTTNIIYELIIMLVIILFFYYSIGIFSGFDKNQNYYSLIGIKDFILPIIIGTVLKELLRYNILQKSEGSKFLLIVSIFLLILLDLVNIVSIKNFYSNYSSFLVICLYILPAISNNLLCTYLSIKTGYKPCIFYLLVIRLYTYLLPVIPSISDYIYSIIAIVLPVIILYKFFLEFDKIEDKFRERKINKKSYFMSGIVIFCSLTIIILFSGYFKFQIVAIGSGSMEPNINVGDVVIIKKNKDIHEGDVIAYKYNDVIVVHRLDSILVTNDEVYYYTKGDANNEVDSWVVTSDMVIGTSSKVIPYIGLISVWLNDL